MVKFQVTEKCSYLGKTWGGDFTGMINSYSWAKQQMEYRFFKYLKEYKSNNPKISMGKKYCRLDMGDDGLIEVIIKEIPEGK